MTENVRSPLANTPAALGFRMPAEWERHEATWIAWPHNPSDWPDKFSPVPWVYADIVRHLSRVEKVHILVNDGLAEKKAASVLKKCQVALDNIHFQQWPTNRVWTRDYGPIFVKNNTEVAVVNWKFNAWAKYSDWQKDDLIPGKVAERDGLRQWEPHVEVTGESRRVVLEGGSIDVNGQGLLLTTEECLLSDIQQRNPGVSREEMEQLFSNYLGISKVLWLGNGISGDDTHGHVDDISRFVSPDTIVTVVEKNTGDANEKILRENLERLTSATDQHGRKLNIVTLPMPAPVLFRGQRLPASYANFYIANDLVLVPTFNDANDWKALGILAELFPSREVVGIHCGDFIWGLGALHCMTQQQPASL